MANDTKVMRRVCSDFVGDDAVDLDILELKLGIPRIARSKGDRDSLLVKVALLALHGRIDEYCLETGSKYPDYHEFTKWLDSRDRVQNHQRANEVVHAAENLENSE